MTLICSSLPAVLRTAETPAESKALIKHYSTRLVVTQCYSVVKNLPPCGVPPGWVQAYICPKFGIKRRALVTVTEFYGVAADAQLKAVVIDSKFWWS
jgi:hypothetical protein